jgi:hypothetical protein
MKKEYFFITAIVLILLAYGIDSISGAVYFATKSPFGFFRPEVISQYPLSTLGIFARSIGLFMITWLSLSFINRYFFQKFIGLVIVAIISNLYAIQQMATGIKITTPQWSMSIAYAGILLLIPATIYLIKGLISLAKPTPIIQENVSQSEGDTEEIDE